ncbi:hypothetical protein SDC9_173846 [bioreactor metagenome]|uniref:Uncharacterized protein n=1 Tax=bioreactor metagenome TaxID=1076179 RepID=A0A645GKM6_9ZZZZ
MEERSTPGWFCINTGKINPVVGVYNSQRSTRPLHSRIQVSLHGSHSLLFDGDGRIDHPVVIEPEGTHYPAVFPLCAGLHGNLLAQGVLFLHLTNRKHRFGRVILIHLHIVFQVLKTCGRMYAVTVPNIIQRQTVCKQMTIVGGGLVKVCCGGIFMHIRESTSGNIVVISEEQRFK